MPQSSRENRILLSHGSGGKLMHRLIEGVFKKRFSNPLLDQLSDSAVIRDLKTDGGELCFTTDSYVVDPLFFPGGDIGKLAVCGTINDLAVEGATPLYLSCGMIVEEGLEISILEQITDSMAKTAHEQNVKIITGDFKVVEKNKADKIFINTSGIGIRDKRRSFKKKLIQAGDKVLINGFIGEHGVAVLASRGDFSLEMDIRSDCAPLTGLIASILETSDQVKFMRDPTRGGLATTLNEIASDSRFGIIIDENEVPIREETRAACEILGYDPFFLANEGKVVVVAGAQNAEAILQAMRSHPLGVESRMLGEVEAEPAGKVVMQTAIGALRIIDMPVGEQLPRIC